MIGGVSSPANNLDHASDARSTNERRLASGLRINSAKDDAAGLAIATRMAVQLGADNQALRNVNDGLSLAATASGALGQVSGALQDMRALAVQAANATNSASDRQALQQQFDQLAQGIDQIANQTEFNGQKLFAGGFAASLQTGPQPGDTQPLTLDSATTQGLGVSGLSVSSAQGATSALDALDQAISRVDAQQGSIGAAQASLSSAAANLAGTYENLAAAKSRVADTDYATESTNLAQTSVQQQAALQALSLYNANQASALALLKKP